MYITRFTNSNNNILYGTNKYTMETILNKVIITINKSEDSQLLSTHQYAETAGGVNLKQFTMKYRAFNNHVFVNTVFICKRVYFLTVGHQRENGTMDNL